MSIHVPVTFIGDIGVIQGRLLQANPMRGVQIAVIFMHRVAFAYVHGALKDPYECDPKVSNAPRF